MPSGDHIIDRLRQRMRHVRSLGFQVRQEVLPGHTAVCCEIGGRRVMFVDSSQPARDQLAAIDEALLGYSAVQK